VQEGVVALPFLGLFWYTINKTISDKEKLVKKILRMGLFTLVVIVAALTVSPITLAQSVTPTQAQCETAKGRIASRLTKIEAVNTVQATAYTSIQTQFNEFIASAGQGKFDTAAMLTAQEALETKMTTYKTNSAAYSAALLAVKDVTCATSNTELTNAVTTARTALIKARTATTDVRTTIRGQVTDSLKEYATWLKVNAQAGEEKQ
jgi:hypothetical protein